MTGHRIRAAWAVVGVSLAFVAITVVCAVVVSAVTATKIRDSQVSNTRTLENTDETLRVLLDCTDPAGECYQRGQRRTASAVEDISRISVYAAACADRPREQTAREIQDCILELVEAEKSAE